MGWWVVERSVIPTLTQLFLRTVLPPGAMSKKPKLGKTSHQNRVILVINHYLYFLTGFIDKHDFVSSSYYLLSAYYKICIFLFSEKIFLRLFFVGYLC
jgi:hypothetical protein